MSCEKEKRIIFQNPEFWKKNVQNMSENTYGATPI